MKYNVVVASYNSMNWLPRTLHSIQHQDHQNFNVCVIDDASPDPSQAAFIKDTCENNGWAYILNDHHRGAMANQVAGIRELAPESDDDVIVIVDGDDELFHNQVFNKLDFYYAPGVHMTYGNYANWPDTEIPSQAQAYPKRIIETGQYRAYRRLLYNHLRTFKFGLFNQLDEQVDFKWPNGDWFQACCDSAIMLPCLELAGPTGHRFIEEVLYKYNSANPGSDWRLRAPEIDRIHDYILSKLKRKC